MRCVVALEIKSVIFWSSARALNGRVSDQWLAVFSASTSPFAVLMMTLLTCVAVRSLSFRSRQSFSPFDGLVAQILRRHVSGVLALHPHIHPALDGSLFADEQLKRLLSRRP